jgi:hypothetical protein
MSRWEAVSQMCFLQKGFRWPSLNLRKQFESDKNAVLKVPSKIKDNMKIWSTIAKAEKRACLFHLLLQARLWNTTLSFLTLQENDLQVLTKETGVKSVDVCNSKTWIGCRLFWQTGLTLLVPQQGRLWMVGLRLPILIPHKQLQHQEICNSFLA